MSVSSTAWLRAWDSHGLHRTGTAGDQAGADWLAREAAALLATATGTVANGVTLTSEAVGLDRIDPGPCWLAWEGGRIEGIPVFDSPPTGADGVDGPIAVVPLSPWVVYTPDYPAMRRKPDQAGLAIVCQGAEPGFGLLNAEQFRDPYGCPAIHLPEPVPPGPYRLMSHYRRTRVEARNVVVTIPGRDPSRRPIVVMTPRSSWWQSTSERGGGLVCWLETLRCLLAAAPAATVVLTANTGHELGHLGLDTFLEHRPGWDQANGAIWVHYGANIGAAGGQLSIQSADGPLRQAAREALTAAGRAPDAMTPATHVPSGETRDIHKAGGRYVTLVGTNRLFHLPQDRWPHVVDVDVIDRVAAGAAAMVAAIAA